MNEDRQGELSGMDRGVAACRADANGLLLDVRTPEEYAGGHVPGSVNQPLDTIPTMDIEYDKKYYVYCRSGARSGRACALMAQMDGDAVNIGGILDYSGRLEK